MAHATSHTDATRASVSVDDDRVNNVNVQRESSSENAPLRGSYASATRVNRVPDDVIPVTGENALPNRPLTVYFQPRYFLLPDDLNKKMLFFPVMLFLFTTNLWLCKMLTAL